ncbi:MAG: PEP/pyruvate-binding domain-containing protein [Myxococcota bacterium]
MVTFTSRYTRWLHSVSTHDVAAVGTRNALLGEMARTLGARGIRVPGGFAITVEAYRSFLQENGLSRRVTRALDDLSLGKVTLEEAGAHLREHFLRAEFPEELALAIRTAYRELCHRHAVDEVNVAVRGSATLEEHPHPDPLLNVRGESALLEATRDCFAALFSNRAIAWRRDGGVDHLGVALSVGVQKMVRSDMACAGVMSSMDHETGFPHAVIIQASWGLGALHADDTADQYTVFKPLLRSRDHRPIVEKRLGTQRRKLVYGHNGTPTTFVDTSPDERGSFILDDEEILELARRACAVEEHFGRPVDLAWARDGFTGELYVVHAQPRAPARLGTDPFPTDTPTTRTQIMINLANPAAAFRAWKLPSRGIGLARLELIINHCVKVHPMALVRYDELKDAALRAQVDGLTRGYRRKTDYFVDSLARGLAKLACAQHPYPVMACLSDFRSDEHAGLVGGALFEPREVNPVLGLRGASRYYSDAYREAFALECQALRKVREEMGLRNVAVMVPFCRTLEEADRVLELMSLHGLKRGVDGLEVHVTAEVPANVILAEQFAERFDGFSIGSNDLTQLVLGVDRGNGPLAALFDERNDAVKAMIRQLIRVAHARGRKVGICGPAPSVHPEFAQFLVEAGIDSISLHPDCVLAVQERVAQAERARYGA